MKGNIITRDKEIIAASDAIYGDNRMTYSPYAIGLAGNSRAYNSGKFEEQSHATVVYDLTQKFPQDAMVEALKPTQTELRQIHAASSEFSYNQYASGVEFSVSNMSGASVSNVRAGILNNLAKKWDSIAFFGDGVGNYGFINHPKSDISSPAGAASFDLLVSVMQDSLANIKDISDVTGSTLNRIKFAHSGGITAILDKYEAGSQQTNRTKLKELFPEMFMEELPGFLLPGNKYLMTLSDVVTLHHASLPGLYATEPGKYGLSESSLYAFESTAVELELTGAIQEVTLQA